ncbi:MAG TPA: amidase [Candidatus Acidoferrales bacterium]|nr:amidase [Candidatus Acidoferrales bacterium]
MLRQFLEALESGKKTQVGILYDCLSQIAATEPTVRAWVAVAAQPFLEDKPLSGIPYGAKDIIETNGLATEYGSPLYEGRQGEFDADVVTTLRRAGALLLGKTQTTAFASFDPAPTRNPRLAGHTPGGSSSGSAAAVAAGMVPFALGTQTLGSVLRPASYCGVCGFKPTFGLIPSAGVLPFAPSLDTIGFFTQTAADMACLWSLGFAGNVTGELHRAALLRVNADGPMTRAVQNAAGKLRQSGVAVEEMDPPAGWLALTNAAITINRYEGARSHRERMAQYGTRIGIRLADLVRTGLEIPEAEYHQAVGFVAQMRTEITNLFWDYPAVLTPAATGAPPAGLASTGDPANNAPWTALGVPAISVPLPVEGAPLGLQITSAWGRDDALVAVAVEAERVLR